MSILATAELIMALIFHFAGSIHLYYGIYFISFASALFHESSTDIL